MSQAMSERGVKANAKTVAQFLISNGRFDFNTMQYQLSDTPARDVSDTVIIDECSMLTEEMFGALLQALRSAGRIILVGDPNQLPPIGVGRPFVDLVRYLSKDLPAYCSPSNKELWRVKIKRRQKAKGFRTVGYRAFKVVCRWGFQLDESVFEKLQQGEDIGTVVFKQWADNDELEACILQTLSEELGLKDVGDQDGFDRSLGGNVTERGTYFNVGCAKSADKWQILAPVRNMPYGVTNINHLMHKTIP
jgi:ATP-dependent exoDNAse (exonuclease V) alpha subunit